MKEAPAPILRKAPRRGGGFHSPSPGTPLQGGVEQPLPPRGAFPRVGEGVAFNTSESLGVTGVDSRIVAKSFGIGVTTERRFRALSPPHVKFLRLDYDEISLRLSCARLLVKVNRTSSTSNI